jgi:hypothetical protein
MADITNKDTSHTRTYKEKYEKLRLLALGSSFKFSANVKAFIYSIISADKPEPRAELKHLALIVANDL